MRRKGSAQPIKLQQFGIVGSGGTVLSFAVDDAAGRAVERNPVAILQRLAL